jgi:Dolichyl-phosphate-mannose-protein mannosyltransferase
MRRHGDRAAVIAVAVVFVIRIVAARDRYLSADEALHVEAASAPSLVGVYENSRFLAHPPLFFLLLHFWLRAGSSEFFLRSLPALFGVGFLCLAHRWARLLLGRTAGLTALLLVAFSPALLPLAAEVRGYSLLLFLATAALAELEAALEARSPARMAGFSLLLFLAILTHFAALFLTMSLFAYALVRFWRDRPPRRVFLIWALFQAGAAALYLFLYFTQVAPIRGTEAVQTLTGPLSASYFHHDRETASAFLVRQAAALSRYLFGPPIAAAVLALLAAAGVACLALRRRPSALLLALPGLLGAVCGLMALYPFGGTRHSAYLLPFAGAAVGAAISALSAGRPWALLSCIALLPLLWGRPDWSSPPRSLLPTKAAIERLRTIAPRGSLLWTDRQTGAVLRYYFGAYGSSDGPGLDYRLVRSPVWASDPERLGEEVERLIRIYRLSAGQRFWMIRLGVEDGSTAALARRVPAADFSVVGRFGDLLIIEVRLRDSSAGRGGPA